MGRRKSNEIRKYFRLSENNYICNTCHQTIKGDNVTNLARHLKVKHQDLHVQYQINSSNVVDNITFKKKKYSYITVRVCEQDLWEGCIELATTTSAPLNLVANKGFKKLLNPIMEKFEMENTINPANLKLKIKETVNNIKREIKNEVASKLISLKLDGVSRHFRHLIGINIQYVNNGKIQIRTLAVKELYEQQTANNIKLFIMKTLSDYNISLGQIYATTTDNGRNMIKAKQLLLEDYENEEDDEDEDEEEDLAQPFKLNEVEAIILKEKKITSAVLNPINCAAHTLQLVVNDIFKVFPELTEQIEACRKIVVALRKPRNFSKLTSMALPKPKLNVPTRWNSSYDMVKRLVELEEFCKSNSNDDQNLYMSDELVGFMKEFLLLFKPIKITTMNLQNSKMILGDFYKFWLQLKLNLKKITSVYTAKVMEILNEREQKLLENQVVLAGLFLDPRFHFLLNTNQRNVAIAHLIELNHTRLKLIAKPFDSNISPIAETATNTSTGTILSDSDSVEEDELTKFLNALENTGSQSVMLQEISAQEEIRNFYPARMHDHSIDILKYWQFKKNDFPNLFFLAEIIHSVPATQVSVERAFSALKLVLSDTRNKLSGENLENILIVRLNKEFT